MKLDQAFTLFGNNTTLRRQSNKEDTDKVFWLRGLKFWTDEQKKDAGLKLPQSLTERMEADDWEPASPPNKRAKI